MSLSPFKMFVEKWRGGCGSCLCEHANRIVLARGDVPCDIVFVGEAPGTSEDIIGLPFVGPAGSLLDTIVKESVGSHKTAFCNLVGCIPLEEDGSKATEPDAESILKCGERLIEFVGLCQPKLIVCVGKLAGDWLDVKWKKSIQVNRAIPRVSITHPAAVLRANVTQQGLMRQRAVATLRQAVEEMEEHNA